MTVVAAGNDPVHMVKEYKSIMSRATPGMDTLLVWPASYQIVIIWNSTRVTLPTFNDIGPDHDIVLGQDQPDTEILLFEGHPMTSELWRDTAEADQRRERYTWVLEINRS